MFSHPHWSSTTCSGGKFYSREACTLPVHTRLLLCDYPQVFRMPTKSCPSRPYGIYMHFVMGNHFFPMGFKHLGVRLHCQVSMATNLTFKLASFTPPTEDPQALLLHRCVIQQYSPTSPPCGLARTCPHVFPHR